MSLRATLTELPFRAAKSDATIMGWVEKRRSPRLGHERGPLRAEPL